MNKGERQLQENCRWKWQMSKHWMTFASNILDYNRDRFEAIAIRVYVGNETIITIYALDKTRQENATQHEDKLPVKKFKLENLSLDELMSYCSAFNLTLSTGNYDIEDMEVINK